MADQPVEAAFEHAGPIIVERRTSADGRPGVRVFLDRADAPWVIRPDRRDPA